MKCCELLLSDTTGAVTVLRPNCEDEKRVFLRESTIGVRVLVPMEPV